MTGTILGNRYTILEELGTGGMATVYKARCAYLQRDVAIKVLRPEYRNDADLVRRFETEARAAASLTHPNIVQIYDVGNEGGIDYIVMELVDGRSLKELLAEHGPMPWQMAAEVMAKVASALQKAHAKKIVHRDIKPQNILLTAEGEPKVADFGIARVASGGMETMKVDTVASVHYASPEHVRGGYTDAQSDLYSVGVTLYEMLTGVLPFAGDNPVSVALRHIQDAIPRVDAIQPDVPKALADIVEKCMQKNRADRYADASALIADLESVLRAPETAVVEMPKPPQPTTAMTPMEMDIPVRRDHAAELPASRPASSISAVREEEGDMGYRTSRRSTGVRNGNDRMRKIVFPLIYIVLIVVIIALVTSIIRFVTSDLGASPTPEASSKKEFTVGAYKGRNIDEVLTEIGDQVKTEVHRIQDATVPADQVIRQEPLAGSKIVAGGLTVIELYVSAGQEMVKMPDIASRTLSDVLVELRDTLGLEVEQKFEYNETLEADKVIRLEPASGTEVARGSKVLMVVSLGKEQKQVSMPDLTTLDRQTAEARLQEYHLMLGAVTPADTPATGAKVTKQSITPGDPVPEGTTVDLTFDVPPSATPTPAASNDPSPSATPATTDPGPAQAKTSYELTWDSAWAGDSVQVTVVVRNKTTGEETMPLDAKVTKDEFPYTVIATIPDGGGTLLVYVNGTLHYEKEI